MSANVFTVNVYQINSQDPIPLGHVSKIGFPGSQVLITVANDPNGNPGVLLSSGVRCYGNLRLIATGSQYLTDLTQSALVTLANV